MITNENPHEYRKSATLVGILYILGTVAGILSVVFIGPVLGDPGALAESTANANRLVVAALFVLTMGVVLAMVPVVLYPILKKFSGVLALGYLIFRGALETFTYLATVISWLFFLSLSQVDLPAGTSAASNFQALGAAMLESEGISSVTTIVFILGALMFYAALYQSKLVPRWISGWGLLSTLPYLLAGLLVMFGIVEHMSTLDAVLRLPLGIQEMALAVWLIVKGFNPSAFAPEPS